MIRFARLAMIARCHDGPWWELDDWHPRCDPRIPLSHGNRRPTTDARRGGSPSRGCATRSSGTWARRSGRARCAGRPSARNGCPAWSGSTAGCQTPSTTPAMSWATRPVRPRTPRRSAAGTADPHQPVGRSGSATAATDPSRPPPDQRRPAGGRGAARVRRGQPGRGHRACWGPHRGSRSAEAHAASWFRQVSRIPHKPGLNAQHYVDDHALAQITAALPLLGLPREATDADHPRRRHPGARRRASVIRRRCG